MRRALANAAGERYGHRLRPTGENEVDIMATTIRPATLGDARGIAEVHVASWRSTYRGIVPEAHLDALSVDRRTATWAGVLSDEHGQSLTVVAIDPQGQIVGFASGGRPQDPDPTCAAYAGELHVIYLLADHQGRGIGRRLVAAVAAGLAAQGMTSLQVWTLAANPACRFYESLGGVRIGEKPTAIGGASLTEVAYGWLDSTPLC